MGKGKRHNGKDFFNRIAIGFPRNAILREVMNWKDSGPKISQEVIAMNLSCSIHPEEMQRYASRLYS